MPLEPVPILPDDQPAILPVETVPFEVRLPIFEGPLQLLLHLIESRQLDVLSVPLAEVADAYLEHLARNPVDAPNLAEFVAIAAQLIWLKSRRMLPGELPPGADEGSDEPDEEQLRQRLIEYRAVRDASRWLGERDMRAPLMRREPRESDLPEAPVVALPMDLLVASLERLAETAEPEAPPPEVVARELTIGMQIRVLLEALSSSGRVVLQSVLAGCRSRSEAAVTVLAMLELARRRQVSLEQESLFGPILVTTVGASS
jgi:segregation and condensation protein A